MGKEKSIKLNYVMNCLLTVSSFVFPLISFPYVSRVLQPSGIGKVAFANSIVSYFLLISQLGMPTYAIRTCAKVRDDPVKLSRTVHELFIINAVMTCVAYAGLAIAVYAVPRLREERALYLVVSSTILFNCVGMEWLYKSLEKYTYITIRSVFFKFIAIIAMFLLVRKQEDYIFYGVTSVLASSASNIMNFIHARRYITMKPLGGYEFRRHFKPIAVFFLISCAGTVYNSLDSTMLGVMKLDVDVGYYNAAIKIKSVLLSLVTSLGTVLLPRVSYYYQNHETERFWATAKKAIEFTFLIASPLVLYFTIFAKTSILFLSGENYLPSVRAMQIILPTLLLIGLSNILGIQILVPVGCEKYVLISQVFGAIVDIIINILLIPSFAAAGAAFGTLIAEFTVLGIQVLALRKDAIKMFRTIPYLKIFIALMLSSAVSCLIMKFSLGIFFELFFSALLFFGTYALVLLLTREQLVMEVAVQIVQVFKGWFGLDRGKYRP